MPGSGKTTLAKMLSKQLKEKKLFDETVWICVSRSFDEHKILRGILESLDKNAGGIVNIDAILQHLRQNLRDRSLFLVLDDVWNENSTLWKSLMDRLINIINKGKKICVVVTTRSDQVALITETVYMQRHYLTKLSDDECWSIIKNKVFENVFEEIPRDLEDMGKKVAKQCGGLPLLARVLGGTMHLRKGKQDWSSIIYSPVWGTPDEDYETLQILKLSFDRLSSPSLKQCFAYCAIFPNGYQIETKKLIQLWIAQGYVQPNNERNMTAEDVGRQYFNILLANSLFQDVKKDKFGDIESCKMHDVLYGLAKFVSMSDIWNSNLTSKNDISNIRHVRLGLNAGDEMLTRLEKFGCQRLRSMFSEVKVFNNTSWSSGRMRVLDIHDSGSADLPTSVGKLIHLRYLDISNNPICRLPRSISKLYNLETLRFTDCSLLEKPLHGIENLEKLKHIHFNNPDHTPYHIGKLTCLQTLPLFAVGTERGLQIEELHRLKQLSGKMEIYRLENVKDKSNACDADMKGKQKLRELAYVWSDSSSVDRNVKGNKLDYCNLTWITEEDVLEGLEPPRNLLILTIINFGGRRFTSWLSDHLVLVFLRRLELYDCPNCIELPTLGYMPCLEYLGMRNIGNVKCINTKIYSRIDGASTGSGRQATTLFPSLRALNMTRMSKLEEWVMPTEEGLTIFPCLESVSISECHELKNIPVLQPTSLKRLNLYRCSKLISLPVSHLSSLRELIITTCPELSDLGGMPSGSGLRSLIRLSIQKCGIYLLPSGLQFSRSLQDFNIDCLPNLTVVPEYIGDLSCLIKFKIEYCEALKNVPSFLQSRESLTMLKIALCENLENVPENLEELSFLEYLVIYKCPKLVRAPRKFPSRHGRLRSLDIGGFPEELEEFPTIHSTGNSSLEYLSLTGWNRLKSIPYLHSRHFTSLKGLSISSFNGIESLPEWLGNLSSLVSLGICECKNLGSLPRSMTRLTNLNEIYINECPVVAAQLSSDETLESYKVSHIPKISVDGRWLHRTIQPLL